MVDYETKKQLEAALPILIILLLIVGVIALKPGLLAGIPIIGEFFSAPAANVMLVTDESQAEENAWKEHLSGKLAEQVFGNPLNVEAFTVADLDNKVSSAEWIKDKGYDVVVLTSTKLTGVHQRFFRDWVEEQGGKLLVVGIGGTQENGRWGELTNVMPVQCGAQGDCSDVIDPVYQPKMHTKEGNFEHQLSKTIDKETEMAPPEVGINVARVISTNDVIYIDGYTQDQRENKEIFPGISEKTIGLNGKVLYCSFNPVMENINSPVEESLVVNLLAYAVGKEGHQSV
jgi:hypothetical protein